MTLTPRTFSSIAAAVLGGAIGFHSYGFAQDQDLSAGAARGEQLYYDHACYSCHGYNGETGARDLVGTGSPIVENLETFVTFLRLRADLAPLFPTTQMPNYPETALSDAEAADIFAYIQTFELDAPDVEDLPALQTILESAAQPNE
jgi:mono/diheme cytochrome c family protein